MQFQGPGGRMKSGGKSILKLTVAGSLSAQPDKARLQPQAATLPYPHLESCKVLYKGAG